MIYPKDSPDQKSSILLKALNQITGTLFLLLVSTPSFSGSSEADFFKSLKGLCGQSFIGDTVFPKDPDHPFANKALIMKVKHCDKSEVRIPFQVGEDKSRTWVISLTEQGLLLKHDHRHKDGTPDEITMYGGYSNKKGSSLVQSFPADAHTSDLIPEATTNIWTLEIKPESMEFVYSLSRHGKPRYKAEFSISPPLKRNDKKD